MADLKCGVKNCVYNCDCLCSKGDIMVGGKHAEKKNETCCESFSDRGRGSARNGMEHPCHVIGIDCEATRCIYNVDYKCKADHVNIMGDNACVRGETCCGSFSEAKN